MSNSSQGEIVNMKTAIGTYLQSDGQTILGEKFYQRIQPSGDVSALNSAFGGPAVSFEIQKYGPNDYLASAKLFYQVSAITAGTGATYTYFVNAPMIFMHDHIDLVSNNQPIQRIYDHQIWENLYRNYDSDEFQLISQEVGYNTSTSVRSTNAQSPQCFSLNLKNLFNHIGGKPIDISLYPNLKITCYFKNSQNYVINTNSTTNPSFTFLQAYLSCQYVRCPPPIIAENRKMVLSSNPPLHYDVSYILIQKPLASGNTTYALNIGSDLYGKNIIDITFKVILNTNLSTNFTSDYTGSNVAIYSFALKSNNNYINNLQSYEIYAQDYLIDMLGRQGYEGIAQILSINNAAATITFAQDHRTNTGRSAIKYRGSRIFTERDTELNLTFSSSLSANATCIMCVREAKMCKNVMGQLTLF